MVPISEINPLLKIVRSSLYDLPSPSNLTRIWNFGSLLGLCLSTQILTGLFLSIHYCGNAEIAFIRVRHICRDVNYGWLIRVFHANGARFFFRCLFIHIGRGLYFGRYYFKHVWIFGVYLLFSAIATAFFGYVLPWGQISFWGATVITNLLSAIPGVGRDLVIWVWGGFAVGRRTLSRFYTLHFVLPFLILGLRGVHLLFLHQTGRRNPLGLNRNFDKISFHPYFSAKDLLGAIVFFGVLRTICFFFPWSLGDPENFIPANPIVTPVHIQPEWYFLISYAILRSITNKFGGVLALGLSILILIICPFVPKRKFKRICFYPLNQFLFWTHVNVWMVLTWLGARPIEIPYIFIGQIFSIIYFMYYFLSPILQKGWDQILD